MSREFDVRDHDVVRATRDRVLELRASAEVISGQLPGDERITVESIDPRSATATVVKSAKGRAVGDDVVTAALDHVQSILPAIGLLTALPIAFRADDHVSRTSTGAVAVHLQQTLHEIPIFQAAQTVQFSADHVIEATMGKAIRPLEAPDPRPSLTPADAVKAAADFLAESAGGASHTDQFGEPLIEQTLEVGALDPVVITDGVGPDKATVLDAPPFEGPIYASLVWFDIDAAALRLAWELIIGLSSGERYRVIVDAQSGQTLYCHGLVATVAARGNVCFPDGAAPRQMRNFPLALNNYPIPTPSGLPSPFPRSDWISSDRTEGENVTSHLNGGNTAQGTTVDGVMTFNPADSTGDDQTRLNLCFLNNYIHDFLYLLGFREADGNFQTGNGGKGGAGNDRVDAIVHPGAVWGTANMYTPPDGTAPTMNMGLVTSTNRHTALDSGTVFHEYTHGLTQRLVGGPANTHALDAIQSGSMGEGWSDYIACTINGTTVLGNWVLNNTLGFRAYRYDSNFPDNYGMLGTGRYNGVHNNGEIWCAALMEFGRRIGAARAVQIVVDALKLTPANPTYLQARDAVLTALENKGQAEGWSASDRRSRRFAAWGAFAKFGMGYRAKSGPSTGYAGIVGDFTLAPTSRPLGLAEYRNELYAAWKGMNDDQGIYWSKFSPNTSAGAWRPQLRMPNVATSVNPALAMSANNAVLYAAWKGMNADQGIYWSKYDLNAWAPQQRIPNVATSVGPSLITFNGVLYAAWKGMNADQGIYWSTFNGTTWAPQQRIANVATSVGPSLEVFRGLLFAAWKGMDADQGIYWSTFNGTTWSPQQRIPNVATNVGPALATVGLSLFAAWKGMDTDQGIYWSTFNGTTWAPQQRIPNVASSVGPELAMYQGDLYAAWKGMGADQGIYWSKFTGTAWGAQQRIPNVATSG